MKNAIVKAIVLCTLALSLLFVGVSACIADSDVAVAGVKNHDGPYNDGVVY